MKNVKNDIISRQAAIDAIVNTVSEIGLHDNSEVARYGATFRQHEIIDILEALPSAQPQRKKGKWIHKNDIYGVTYCSECDFELHIDNTSFCPNCGAEMVKGEDDGHN